MIRIPEVVYPYKPVGPVTNKSDRIEFAKSMQGYPRSANDFEVASVKRATAIPAVDLLSRVKWLSGF